MTSGPTAHELLVYYAGDTILIDVTCKDASGAVINLTNASIDWWLGGPDGERVAHCQLGDGIEITSDGPEAGKIEITYQTPKNMAVGYYKDQLRITTNIGIVAMQMVGLIEMRTSIDSPQQLQASVRIALASAVAAAGSEP